MDMTESIAPKSDQLDAVDLISGPRTFTITKVTEGKPDQPFNFHLEGFPRVWRPGKSMRRVIVAAWGSKPPQYAGKSVTLYCDPSVEFGGVKIGGTRISHMSHIDGPLSVPLIIKRGKVALFTVQPLKAEPARNWDGLIEGCTTVEELRALYKAGTDENAPQIVFEAIEKKAATITTKDD